MVYLEVKVPQGIKIAVIGDVHGHEPHFDAMLEKISPSKDKMFFVSVGDIYHKGFGLKAAESITNKMRALSEGGMGFIVQGNHELQEFRKAKKSSIKLSEQLAWLKSQPLAISFVFHNQTRVTVLHGGVTPVHTWEDLKHNTEIAYIRTVNVNGQYIRLERCVDGYGNETIKPAESGALWHDVYDGRFGYIASGHNAQHDGKAKSFKYSCNVDSAVYNTGILTSQVFSSNGLDGDPIKIELDAATPGKKYW